MYWKQRLFKPKWQNKNADIRLEAVTHEQDPDLIQSLVEIAAGDSDPKIRCAAVKRLHQLGNILKLYANETDPTVKALQEERIRQLAAATNETRPPLDLRLQVVKLTKDRTLIEHIATHAPEAELRRAAMEKVTRQGVVGDCCIKDKDADNRRFAASHITQHTTLKRVIEALRKRDKALYAELKERLQNELIEQADPKAIQAEALRICVRLEHLAIETTERETTEIKSLHIDWKPIANKATAAMQQRYQRICERLDAPVVVDAPPLAIEPVIQEVEAKQPSVSEPEKIPQANDALIRVATDICLYEVENPDKPNVAKLSKMKVKLESAWHSCQPPHSDDKVAWSEANESLQRLEADFEKRQQEADKGIAEAEDLLKKLESQLEDGELHKALETRAQLQQHIKDHGNQRAWKAINSRLGGTQARLRELGEWQHWSNDKIRKRLIAEMEILPQADLHPDALLDRVKSLQMEWKALEQSEQIPGDKHFASASWMWRKFSAAGNAAFDTAKPYLDKRSEIQSRHAQSLATFCAELEQLTKAEPQDLTALAKAMTRGRKKLHDLNNIPAKQRQRLAKQLKAALDSANAIVQENYQRVEREKMKLIRSASQLIHMTERSEAITQAKALQSNWKAAGSLWRSKEQELWNQFREHLDPLFEELKEQQASVRAETEENLSVQKALCTDMKALLASAEDLTSVHGKVQGLQDGWKDIEHPDRKLQGQFQDLLAKYHEKVKQAELQQVDADRDRRWLKSTLLHELSVSGRTAKGALSKKAATNVTKSWPESSSDNSFEQSMDKECEKLLGKESAGLDDATTENLIDEARILSIRMEFVAGLPSPDEDRDQRMQYQVDRLAESMSGGSARPSASEEASQAENTWLGMYALPEVEFKSFGQRIQKALSTISENI
jgi:exonuclease SbcC